jgi:hypothetical protein
VVEFHRKERLRELKEEAQQQASDDGDYLAQMMALYVPRSRLA